MSVTSVIVSLATAATISAGGGAASRAAPPPMHSTQTYMMPASADPERGYRTAAAEGQQIDGRRIVIVDGDTIALPCAVPGRGCAEKVRLRDIDAPESYEPRCENELRAGLAAKERLGQLIRSSRVTLVRTGTDPFGRTLGLVYVEGQDVGRILMHEGLALPYSPDRRAKEARIAHWCGPRW